MDGQLLREMTSLRDELMAVPELCVDVHPEHRASARNLSHFLALRNVDRRDLQDRLSSIGVSSLGRCEAHVLATVASVVSILRAMDGEAPDPPLGRNCIPGFQDGSALLEANTAALLGPAPPNRPTRIMVTLPPEAATDPTLVDEYVRCGMDIARINCAHDNAAAWRTMARHVRDAAHHARRDIPILMDLAGPKLRTGPIEPGPCVIKIRPVRDALGRVRRPTRVMLVPADATPPSGDEAHIPLSAAWLDELQPDDELHLVDSRGASRSLRVVQAAQDGNAAAAECMQTTYITNGTLVRHGRRRGVVTNLPPTPGHLTVQTGDALVVTTDLTPASSDESSPPRIGCTLPEAINALAPGHRVFLDDGKIAGVVESASPTESIVRITATPPGGAKLRSEKGINLPDTTVPAPSFTTKDDEDLAAVIDLADMVGLSFVRQPSDVEALQRRLDELDANHLGVVLKIETTQGFQNLPSLVRTAMRTRNVGVMIARGDLAVEAGYQRLAEVQEEILWLCEAAHLPVIWATEVLDRLAKTGRPSRSEITDAAMSERAECVMLNKGPHVADAIRVLDDILTRMAAHQRKKRPLLRRLRSWSST